MKNLTIKQLRGFVAIAEEHSFTRAAHKLRVSQSALTIAIQDLETEVRVQLLDRTTRSVELTAHGKDFLPVAVKLLEDLAHGVENLHRVADRQRGSVTVTSIASFINVVLAPAIASLSRKFSGISVQVIEDSADSLIKRVQHGEVDFGVGTLWRTVEEIEANMLLKDRLGVLFRNDHPLALAEKDPTWSDLGKFPLASLAYGSDLATLSRNSHFASLLSKRMYEVSSVSSLLALVESGVGIAVLPAMAAYSSGMKALRFRPIRRPFLHRPLFYLTRQGRSLSPAAQTLSHFMLAQLQEIRESENLTIVAQAEGIDNPGTKRRGHRDGPNA